MNRYAITKPTMPKQSRLYMILKKADLKFILTMYFKIIDPTQVDQQGPDMGRQYRTGIYFTDSADDKLYKKN